MVWATIRRGGPKDDSGGSTVELTDDVVLVGRSERCQVRFNDTAVSSQHCRLISGSARGGVCVLEDLSVNGTFVNGAKVGRGNAIDIRDGDQISLLRPTNDDKRGAPHLLHFRYVTSALPDDQSMVSEPLDEHEAKPAGAGAGAAKAIWDIDGDIALPKRHFVSARARCGADDDPFERTHWPSAATPTANEPLASSDPHSGPEGKRDRDTRDAGAKGGKREVGVLTGGPGKQRSDIDDVAGAKMVTRDTVVREVAKVISRERQEAQPVLASAIREAISRAEQAHERVRLKAVEETASAVSEAWAENHKTQLSEAEQVHTHVLRQRCVRAHALSRPQHPSSPST